MIEHVQGRRRRLPWPRMHRASRQCDLDHDVEWPRGPTGVDNLTAKHRPHHRVKTAGWWSASRDDDALVTWRTRPAAPT